MSSFINWKDEESRAWHINPKHINKWRDRLKTDLVLRDMTPQAFVSDYTDLICQNTAECYERVLKRA
jgi:hypothetical protein